LRFVKLYTEQVTNKWNNVAISVFTGVCSCIGKSKWFRM
jgi:hypothetical protein